MKTLDEIKSKVIGVCNDVGGALPYEDDQLMAENWGSLADELGRLASSTFYGASRLAGYAGVCRRKANTERKPMDWSMRENG